MGPRLQLAIAVNFTTSQGSRALCTWPGYATVFDDESDNKRRPHYVSGTASVFEHCTASVPELRILMHT